MDNHDIQCSGHDDLIESIGIAKGQWSTFFRMFLGITALLGSIGLTLMGLGYASQRNMEQSVANMDKMVAGLVATYKAEITYIKKDIDRNSGEINALDARVGHVERLVK